MAVSANQTCAQISFDIEENSNCKDSNSVDTVVPAPAFSSRLYKDIRDSQWPIVYSPEYNIGFLGLEKLHPFDSRKWGRVVEFLKEAQMLTDDNIVSPNEAQTEDLLLVHSKQYLDSLKWSINVAGITEVPPVALLPNFLVQRKVLRPFRYQTGGTVLATKLALERGWAINIGGGFHHCCSVKGGGFCAYADITLAIRCLKKFRNIHKAMIIDLDAHQGNGHERDFINDDSVYILDIYNWHIYPNDGFAKRGIRRKVELDYYIDDTAYLQLVRRHVDKALDEFSPEIVVYNAGTDVLDGDALGCLSISAQGIIERDQIVFQKCRTRNIPVVMVTSGGYQRHTARIIADSILNLRALGLISCDAAEAASGPPSMPSYIRHSQSDTRLWSRCLTSCTTLPRSETSAELHQAAAGDEMPS